MLAGINISAYGFSIKHIARFNGLALKIEKELIFSSSVRSGISWLVVALPPDLLRWLLHPISQMGAGCTFLT